MSPKDIPLGRILPSPRRHSYVRHNRFFPKGEEGTNSCRPQITQTFSPFLPPQNIRYVKTFRFSQRKMKEKSIGQTSLSFLFRGPSLSLSCVCVGGGEQKVPRKKEKFSSFFLPFHPWLNRGEEEGWIRHLVLYFLVSSSWTFLACRFKNV